MSPLLLSVVVVPIVGGPRLQELLQVLEAPRGLPPGTELLVVGSYPSDGRDTQSIEVGCDMPVPKRRGLGASRATGDIVAFVEDTVRLVPGWGEAVIRLHQAHPEVAAIGGSLRISGDLASGAMALALSDYGRFLRLAPTSEEVDALPGNVLSFKRADLAGCGDSIREAELIPALAQSGRGARLESAMGASCIDANPRATQLANRFHHGRLYAGNRFERSALGERLMRAAISPLVAIRLTLRAIGYARAAGLPRTSATLWHTLLLSAAWSSGEMLGCLFGAGQSERHWL